MLRAVAFCIIFAEEVFFYPYERLLLLKQIEGVFVSVREVRLVSGLFLRLQVAF